MKKFTVLCVFMLSTICNQAMSAGWYGGFGGTPACKDFPYSPGEILSSGCEVIYKKDKQFLFRCPTSSEDKIVFMSKSAESCEKGLTVVNALIAKCMEFDTEKLFAKGDPTVIHQCYDDFDKGETWGTLLNMLD